MITQLMTATHALAAVLDTEHRSIKRRAENLLASLEESGVLTKEAHKGGFRWTLKEEHPAFPGGVAAEHGFYLNISKARYETLYMCPVISLMLSAQVRRDNRMCKAFNLTRVK